MSGRIIIVQGAQWGSEAKGAIAARLCQDPRENVTITIRTGSVNAGHTVYFENPENPTQFTECKMQQIPVGWVNPKVQLVIGPGAYIHPGILAREIRLINKLMPGADVRDRLLIDYRVGLHLPEHEDRATKADRHHLIGATGKGCSEAIVSKIQDRGKPTGILFREWLQSSHVYYPELVDKIDFADTVDYLHDAYDAGATMLVEGTQGTFLDMHLGPYPYTTSRMTSAANWIAEAGLAPGMNFDTILVARTYPIRVAGNSGPMGQHREGQNAEIDWPTLTRAVNTKMIERGGVGVVGEESIVAFENFVRGLAKHPLWVNLLPIGSDGLDQHRWSDTDRVNYQYALSELYADALGEMKERGGPDAEAVEDLFRFWERTTVTRKLRRIALPDWRMVWQAARQNRASSIALTFLNYEFPETRGLGDTGESLDFWKRMEGPVLDYIGGIEAQVGVPIRWVSTGPLPHHIIRVRD